MKCTVLAVLAVLGATSVPGGVMPQSLSPAPVNRPAVVPAGFVAQNPPVAPTLPRHRITYAVAPTYRGVWSQDLTVQDRDASLTQALVFNASDRVDLALEAPSSGGRYVLALVAEAELPAYLAAHRPGVLSDPDADVAIPSPLALPDLLIPATGRYVAVIRNVVRFNGTPAVRLQVTYTRTLPPQERQELAQELAVWGRSVEEMFLLTAPLRLRLEPCQRVNAFYDPITGDVTLCTETHALLRNAGRSVDGIVFHELGHALLRMWGLPMWDREDAPDDFAIYMAYQYPTRTYAITADLAQYFLSRDTENDIRGARSGDAHLIGPQRAALIEQRSRDPQAWVESWNRTVYPHMTSTYLRRIVASPRGLESQEEARRALQQRRE